jgi:hypothetical protein
MGGWVSLYLDGWVNTQWILLGFVKKSAQQDGSECNETREGSNLFKPQVFFIPGLISNILVVAVWSI